MARVHLMESVQRWHNSAEEARTKAEHCHDPDAAEAMRQVAQSYEQLAERAKRRLEKMQ